MGNNNNNRALPKVLCLGLSSAEMSTSSLRVLCSLISSILLEELWNKTKGRVNKTLFSIEIIQFLHSCHMVIEITFTLFMYLKGFI